MENIEKNRSFTIEQGRNAPKLSPLFMGLAPTFYAPEIVQEQRKQRKMLAEAKVIMAEKQSGNTDDLKVLEDVLSKPADVVLANTSLDEYEKAKVIKPKSTKKPVYVEYKPTETKDDLSSQILKRLDRKTQNNTDKSAKNNQANQPELNQSKTSKTAETTQDLAMNNAQCREKETPPKSSVKSANIAPKK